MPMFDIRDSDDVSQGIVLVELERDPFPRLKAVRCPAFAGGERVAK